MRIFDSLTNLVTGLGMQAADKKAADKFTFRALSEQEIDAMADGDWVARKIVEAPVDDAFRVWRTWSAKARAVTLLEDAEARHQVRAKIRDAMKLARRYGGSAILIGADTAEPEKPLRPEAVGRGGLQYLTVLSHREISAGDVDRDPQSPTFNQPTHYLLSSQTRGSVRIHPSRLVFFVGAKRYDAGAALTPWGYSALQAPYDAVHNAALASAAGASLLHEAKTDVVQIENLGSQLSTDAGTQALTKRWGLVSMLKSINKTLLLDKSDTWQRSQIAFGGIESMLQRYFQIAAGAADIPAARFLGQSASGLNASGDADIRNYYDRLASDRESDLRPRLEQIDAVLWRDATGRAKPADAVFSFDPLWQPTAKEKADTDKVVADTVKTYLEAAILPDDVLARAISARLIDDRVLPALEQILDETAADDPASEDDPAEPAPKSPRVAAGARNSRRRNSRSSGAGATV